MFNTCRADPLMSSRIFGGCSADAMFALTDAPDTYEECLLQVFSRCHYLFPPTGWSDSTK